jgi:hypothetical protein
MGRRWALGRVFLASGWHLAAEQHLWMQDTTPYPYTQACQSHSQKRYAV